MPSALFSGRCLSGMKAVDLMHLKKHAELLSEKERERGKEREKEKENIKVAWLG